MTWKEPGILYGDLLRDQSPVWGLEKEGLEKELWCPEEGSD